MQELAMEDTVIMDTVGHAQKEKWDEDPWDHEPYMSHGHGGH